MKKAYLSIALIVMLGFSFSFHVLRLDDSFDIITKETLTLRDTYADVRNWGWTDYLSHSPRIRNYLIYEKYYPRLVRMAKENTDKSVDSAKDTLREVEKMFHKWITEKLR